MQQSHPDTTPLPVKKQYRPLKMGTNSFHASLPASRPPTFTCFPKLPCELQLMVWEFALPHRTVYIDVHDVLRSRLRQPPHFPPSISRACRDAHTIATKTGRWLWVGRASDMQQLQQLQRTDRENVSGITTTTTTTMCTNPIRNLRKNILWFDIARDTLLTSNLLLWPQDTKANPVAVEIPVGDVTVTRSLYFDILAEVVPRIWHLDLSKSQLLHFRMLPPPLEELVFQSDKTPPKSPVDLRLWPGYATTTTPTTTPTTPTPAAATAAEIAYADCDLTIAITRPLAPKAHAEFFPEGSTTREKLGRLWHAYASTQDFGRGGSTEAGTARGRTDLDAWRCLEDLWADPAKRSDVFESKRRALAFKWLRLNWMKLTRSERREFGVRGAARLMEKEGGLRRSRLYDFKDSMNVATWVFGLCE
ncbi:hypothetical protein UCREL1_11688 [Eutypa lata UCREL1]|uniref:2EXR domain-containing protein n=1 Tax=Eutypa lata (strain UCR-EL1) TaxID=1287681 RepID=M7T419_EUTLA|nr:hypothetical protein UCREL1_11688 [Eutypa lata UCREL1]